MRRGLGASQQLDRSANNNSTAHHFLEQQQQKSAADEAFKQQQRRDNAEYHALRNGLMSMWLEEANAMNTKFQRLRKEIQLAVDMREQEEAEEKKRDDYRASVKWGEVTRMLTETVAEEKSVRSKLIVYQERSFATIVRLKQHDYSIVEIAENLRKLMRNENNKRYLLERSEERAYAHLHSLYGATDWKPTLKILGNCPFVSGHECPFRNGNCYGLSVPKEHNMQQTKLQQLLKQQQQALAEGGGSFYRSTSSSSMALPQPPANGMMNASSVLSPNSASGSPRRRRIAPPKDPMDKLMAEREEEEQQRLLDQMEVKSPPSLSKKPSCLMPTRPTPPAAAVAATTTTTTVPLTPTPPRSQKKSDVNITIISTPNKKEDSIALPPLDGIGKFAVDNASGEPIVYHPMDVSISELDVETLKCVP